MNNDISNSADNSMKPSNVITLPGCQNLVSSTVPTMLVMPASMHMPDGYVAKPDGIYFFEQDEDGSEHPVLICSIISVVGLCRREDNTSWGRVVDVIDPDGNTHRVVLEESLLAGSANALVRPLLQFGLKIEPRIGVLKQVAQLLNAWRPQKRFLRVARLGWIGETFASFALADGSV